MKDNENAASGDESRGGSGKCKMKYVRSDIVARVLGS